MRKLMHDDNWELINGAPAHRIEQINATNVINLLEAVLTFLLAHRTDSTELPFMPTETVLRELHRAGTILLLATPGEYRTVDVHVANNATGEVVHQPPPHSEVSGHMNDFFKELSAIWKSGDALDAAAYSLWRINWVHPFKNGNGRTARAFAYTCLSGRLGVILPGAPTVIDQVMLTRPEYEACLRVADSSLDAVGQPDLSPMKDYLNRLLQVQIASLSTFQNPA
jgi:hypothetical protein